MLETDGFIGGVKRPGAAVQLRRVHSLDSLAAAVDAEAVEPEVESEVEFGVDIAGPFAVADNKRRLERASDP